ncbi:hypothetical protein HWB05_gp016 [Streptomyces phage BRock]|uniref:Uncharacterized protein n=1 Tax=Streptomyces phage BRock TaxID=1913591 RepID=A0A1J0GVS7_9CAUD|nr:hypothetical protein HWB05_gp016 [Streptomyces phage BRock]APC46278.1 hypothetical protein [Streptomyces phage BRock]
MLIGAIIIGTCTLLYACKRFIDMGEK